MKFLMKPLNFKVNDEYKDLLPTKICYKCSDALLSAAQIRSLCLESDKYLKRQLIDLNLLPMKLEETLKNEKNAEEPFVEIHLEEEDEQLDDHQVDEYCERDVETEQIEFKYEAIYEDDAVSDEKAVQARSSQSQPKTQPKPAVTHEVCEICGKTYTKHYILHHLKTHDADKTKGDKFQCEFN